SEVRDIKRKVLTACAVNWRSAGKFVAVQIANITRAVAEGGNFRSLLSKLSKLEAEQDAIDRELEKVDTEIERARSKRRTAEQVQQVWGRVVGRRRRVR